MKIKYKELSPEMEKIVSPNVHQTGRSSIGFETQVSEYYHIKIENLKPYKKQARRKFDQKELVELSETIKIYGVRQPLTVIASFDNPGFYEVISGERRLKASQLANLSTVPCLIIKDKGLIEEVALIENVQRSDLHPVELGDAYSKLLQNTGRSLTELAKKLGKPISSISENAKLSELPEFIKTYLIENNIRSKPIFRRLCSFKNAEELKVFFESLRKKEKTISSNVIRINLESEDFVIQSNNITKLNAKQLSDLKKILQNFIDSIKS